MNYKTVKRNIGLDALKILSMLMILLLHCISKGGLLGLENNSTFYYVLYYIIEALSIVAVNCYVLVSGYFLVKSEFKWKKVFKIYLETLFYSISIFIIVVVFKKEEFTISALIKSFFPILTKEYWFINSYLLMYILSPFINKMIYTLKQEEYKKLLIILIIAFSIWSLLPNEYGFDTSSGYGIIWFTCLYIIAGYIRLYGGKNEEKTDNKKYLLIYFVIALLIACAMIIIDKICLILSIHTLRGKFLEYNNILVFISSLSIFLYFKNLNIKNKNLSRVITFIGPLTLAVYLIHEQYLMSKILYMDILNVPVCYHNNYSIFIVIGYVISIFIICIGIEYVRQKLISFYNRRKILYEK